VTTSVYHLFVDDKDSKFRFVGADRGVTRGIGSIDASPAKARWFEGLRRDYRRAISYPSPLRRVLRSLPVTPVLLSIETTYSTNSSLGARQGFFFLVAFGFNLSAVAGPALIEPLKLSESEQGRDSEPNQRGAVGFLKARTGNSGSSKSGPQRA
jgi:hypothetical protein